MKPEQDRYTPEQITPQELMNRLHSRVENAPKIQGSDDIPYRDWADDDDD